MELETAQTLLAGQDWTFAKTMPENPHLDPNFDRNRNTILINRVPVSPEKATGE